MSTDYKPKIDTVITHKPKPGTVPVLPEMMEIAPLGPFGWDYIDKIPIPFIFRDGEKLVCSRIVLEKVFQKYNKVFSDSVLSCVSIIKKRNATAEEADLLNEINEQHADGLYGTDKFVANDELFLLEDCNQLQKYLDFCFQVLVLNARESPDKKCGFVRIGCSGLVPYVLTCHKICVPLFYFDGQSEYLDNCSKIVKKWDLVYLKFCCAIHNINRHFYKGEECKVVELDEVIKLFPTGTEIIESWPEKTNPNLLIKQNTRRLSKEANAPGENRQATAPPVASSNVGLQYQYHMPFNNLAQANCVPDRNMPQTNNRNMHQENSNVPFHQSQAIGVDNSLPQCNTPRIPILDDIHNVERQSNINSSISPNQNGACLPQRSPASDMTQSTSACYVSVITGVGLIERRNSFNSHQTSMTDPYQRSKTGASLPRNSPMVPQQNAADARHIEQRQATAHTFGVNQNCMTGASIQTRNSNNTPHQSATDTRDIRQRQAPLNSFGVNQNHMAGATMDPYQISKAGASLPRNSPMVPQQNAADARHVEQRQANAHTFGVNQNHMAGASIPARSSNNTTHPSATDTRHITQRQGPLNSFGVNQYHMAGASMDPYQRSKASAPLPRNSPMVPQQNAADARYIEQRQATADTFGVNQNCMTGASIPTRNSNNTPHQSATDTRYITPRQEPLNSFGVNQNHMAGASMDPYQRSKAGAPLPRNSPMVPQQNAADARHIEQRQATAYTFGVNQNCMTGAGIPTRSPNNTPHQSATDTRDITRRQAPLNSFGVNQNHMAGASMDPYQRSKAGAPLPRNSPMVPQQNAADARHITQRQATFNTFGVNQNCMAGASITTRSPNNNPQQNTADARHFMQREATSNNFGVNQNHMGSANIPKKSSNNPPKQGATDPRHITQKQATLNNCTVNQNQTNVPQDKFDSLTIKTILKRLVSSSDRNSQKNPVADISPSTNNSKRKISQVKSAQKNSSQEKATLRNYRKKSNVAEAQNVSQPVTSLSQGTADPVTSDLGFSFEPTRKNQELVTLSLGSPMEVEQQSKQNGATGVTITPVNHYMSQTTEVCRSYDVSGVTITPVICSSPGCTVTQEKTALSQWSYINSQQHVRAW